MKTRLHADELVQLATFINDNYDGNLARLSHDLDRAVYLLHFVNKDEIDPDQIEETCFALHQISQQLFSSYLRKLVD